jgi:hypothetical protein
MAIIKKVSKFADKLKKSSSSELKKAGKKSLDWFKKNVGSKVASLKKTDDSKWVYKHLKGSDKELRQSIINKKYPEIGSMYFFLYDAKWKKTLEYWDSFPLIIPINYTSNGMLGMNFHYLPYVLRAKLLDSLLSLKATYNDPVFGKREYMKVSYDLLKGLGTTVYKPTIKRYIWSHVKSNFAMVDPNEWENAVFLPAHQFKKQSARYVWSESKDISK